MFKGFTAVFYCCNCQRWDYIWLRKVPEKYKNDFIMLWGKAHLEDVEYRNQYASIIAEKSKEQKDFYKKCFRILAKNFHPDNGEGNTEDMKYLNELKVTWGI